MKKYRVDQDMPIGALKRIDDFLPSPEQLAVPGETVMVTLRLTHLPQLKNELVMLSSTYVS